MEERRDSMLETAKLCFTSAARCEGDGDEEEWLLHYMLGKVAEKQKQSPAVYLQHYQRAAHYLHEEAARYPKKIHYHNPPELAMEALEVRWGRQGPQVHTRTHMLSHTYAHSVTLIYTLVHHTKPLLVALRDFTVEWMVIESPNFLVWPSGHDPIQFLSGSWMPLGHTSHMLAPHN